MSKICPFVRICNLESLTIYAGTSVQAGQLMIIMKDAKAESLSSGLPGGKVGEQAGEASLGGHSWGFWSTRSQLMVGG